MTSLTFTLNAQTGKYEATLPSANCVLQVNMSDYGFVDIECNFTGMTPATIYSFSGKNLVASVAIPDAASLEKKIICTKSVTEAGYEEV